VALAGTMTLLLAPALLTLFGRRTWWLPRWLAKALPHIDVEGRNIDSKHAPQQPPAAPVPVPPITAPALPLATPLPALGVGTQPARESDVARHAQPDGQATSAVSLDALLNGQRRDAPPHSEGGHR
jgi:hypothetical protein